MITNNIPNLLHQFLTEAVTLVWSEIPDIKVLVKDDRPVAYTFSIFSNKEIGSKLTKD